MEPLTATVILAVFISLFGLLGAFVIGWEFMTIEAPDEVTFVAGFVALSSLCYPAFFMGDSGHLPWIQVAGVVAIGIAGALSSFLHQKRLKGKYDYFPQY